MNARQIEVGSGCYVWPGARPEVVNRPGLPPGRLVIGDRVSMEQSAHLVACDSVVIEDDVCIAPRCVILNISHPAGLPGEGHRVLALHRDRLETRICRRVFPGANVVVLPGVTIGENAVGGANSVVTRDLPANVLAD